MHKFYESKAYKYAYSVANGLERKGTVGKYVILQAKQWLRIADGKDEKACIDFELFEQIDDILQLMMFPDNPTKTIHETMSRYTWFFVIATLCTKRRDDIDIRFYETSILEISRKNFKTFSSAIIFILALLLENAFSRFFSVAPDYKLSSELMLAVRKIIKVSPLLRKRFKINRDYVEFKLTESNYTPLAYSSDSLDGKLANMFLADESGLLDSYPIEAMRSSQISIMNKLGIIISTQYPNDWNAFLDEIDFAKRVLDGIEENEGLFALLYEPDEEIKEDWKTDDNVIYQSNPVAIDLDFIFKAIKKKRKMAILYASKKENYLNKHNNIHFIGGNMEGYVNSDDIKKCFEEAIDWRGRRVYLGLDVAESDDNTAVAIVTYDDENDIFYTKTVAIIPTDKILIKSKREKVNYEEEIEKGNCYDCGDDIIDYEFIEELIMEIEEKYDVTVEMLGYDIRNARASAQRLKKEGIECVEVQQHSRVLHPAIKLLREYIIRGRFKYEANKLLDQNFLNCRQTEDTNKNKYLNKQKSVGKIDMVMAIVNAIYLIIENEILCENDWGSQT